MADANSNKQIDEKCTSTITTLYGSNETDNDNTVLDLGWIYDEAKNQTLTGIRLFECNSMDIEDNLIRGISLKINNEWKIYKSFKFSDSELCVSQEIQFDSINKYITKIIIKYDNNQHLNHIYFKTNVNDKQNNQIDINNALLYDICIGLKLIG
eukprot:469101_1